VHTSVNCSLPTFKFVRVFDLRKKFNTFVESNYHLVGGQKYEKLLKKNKKKLGDEILLF
jgi:hypothetical protein